MPGSVSRLRVVGRAAGMALVTAVSLGEPAAAQSVQNRQSAIRPLSDWLQIEAFAGLLSGTSREHVFDAATGRSVSRLDWQIKEMGVLGGYLTVAPASWLSLRVGGWLPFASRNRMDDYDWLVPPFADWSDWSSHDDVPLHRAYMLDARAAVRVVASGRGSISLLAGYRRLHFNWGSRGGSFIYSENGGFRNAVGTFPAGEDGISYKQWFDTPYLGVSARISHERWTLEGELIGAPWAWARDEDNHHRTTTLFEDRANRMTMIGVSGMIGYRLTDILTLTGRAEYQHYDLGRGVARSTDYSTGEVTVFGGPAAGMEHSSLLLSVGLSARLP